MADTGKKELAIRAGIEGADGVGKAADKALSPWEVKAKAVGRALKDAFVGAFSDMAKVVTVGQAITFSRALDEARKFREEVGRLSAVGGPVGQLRGQIDLLGRSKLLRESEIISASRGLGRLTYDAKGSMAALGALQDEALATGETLADKLPIGATLMNGLGVAGGKVGDELGRVRTLADSLGTNGGLLGAEDRLQAISGLLGEIGAKTDGDRAKLEAMALGLGKGLGPEAGKRVVGAILGDVTKDRRGWERFAGMGRGALSDDQGNLRVDKAMEALERGQAKLRQIKDRGTQQLVAANLFGGDYQAGSAFMNADFGSLRAEAERAKSSSKTGAEADAFRGSAAGQAIGRQLDMERNARASAEAALPIADAAQGFLAKNPIAGGIGLNMGVNLAGQGLGGMLGKMGQALMGGGEAVAKGGAAAGASVAAGGAAAGASMRAGAAGGGAGGASLLGKLGLVAAAGAGGYAVGTALDEHFGMSDELSGSRHEDFRSDAQLDNAQLSAEVKANRAKRKADQADRARRILSQFNDVRSDSAYVSGPASVSVKQLAGDDAALQRLAAGTQTGSVNTAGLGPESVAMIKAAIESAKLNITITNNSDSPVTANNAQNGAGMRN